MNEDIQYLKGPRIIDGVNIDADIRTSHPVGREDIADPVNDGSLANLPMLWL